MIRRTLAALALAFAPALASAQLPTHNVEATITDSDPSGQCSDGREWWNSSTGDQFDCYGRVWVPRPAGASFPLAGSDGCAAPPYSFSSDPTMGLCRGLAATWGFDSLVLQTSTFDDFAASFLQMHETNGFFTFMGSLDLAGDGSTIFTQAPIRPGTPWSNVVLNASNFQTGTGAGANVEANAADTGIGFFRVTIDSDASLQSVTNFLADKTTFTKQIQGSNSVAGCSLPAFSFVNDPAVGLCESSSQLFLTRNTTLSDYIRLTDNRITQVAGRPGIEDNAVLNLDGTQLDGSFTIEASDQSDGDTQEIRCRNDLTQEGCQIDTNLGSSNGQSRFAPTFNAFNFGLTTTTFNVRPVAGASGDVNNTAVSVAAMNGADEVNIVNVAVTNATHTGAGNELHGFNVDAITASVSEDSAYYVAAGGWDFAFKQGGPGPMTIAGEGATALVAEAGALTIRSDTANVLVVAEAGTMAVTVDDSVGQLLVRDESLNAVFTADAGADIVTIHFAGRLQLGSDVFANLGAETNGTLVYCSDCTKATPCAGVGAGAFAKRINAAWDCD